MSEGNRRSSSNENDEVSHRKPSKELISDSSPEAGPILKENANREGGKREQTSLGKVETLLGPLPRASITTESPTDTAPSAKELTSNPGAQENPQQEPHKAPVEE